jgi:GGDEF domain-containing protein
VLLISAAFGVAAAAALLSAGAPATALGFATACWLAGGAWAWWARRQPGTGRRQSFNPLPAGQDLVDPETGISNARQFVDILEREMARGQRYHELHTLCVFELQVAGFTPSPEMARPPSPAPFAVAEIVEVMRRADFVARLGPDHFAVLLLWADQDGARAFIDRVRTAIGKEPFADGIHGQRIYAGVFGGCATFSPEHMATPAAYLRAAQIDLQAHRPAWFHGERAS